jgi:hypothetical protein
MKKVNPKMHDHTGDPEMECEECGGEVEVISAVNPMAYKCVCKKCNHTFEWVAAEGRDLR